MGHKTILCHTQIREACRWGRSWAQRLLSLLSYSRAFCGTGPSSWNRPMTWCTQKTKVTSDMYEGKEVSSSVAVCLFQIQGSYSIRIPCWPGTYCIAQALLKLTALPASVSGGLEFRDWAIMPVWSSCICVCLRSSKRKQYLLPDIIFTCTLWIRSFLVP